MSRAITPVDVESIPEDGDNKLSTGEPSEQSVMAYRRMLDDLDRPLPAVPSPGSSSKKPAIIFCDSCSASIPVVDILTGVAIKDEVSGKHICGECLEKGVTFKTLGDGGDTGESGDAEDAKAKDRERPDGVFRKAHSSQMRAQAMREALREQLRKDVESPSGEENSPSDGNETSQAVEDNDEEVEYEYVYEYVDDDGKVVEDIEEGENEDAEIVEEVVEEVVVDIGGETEDSPNGSDPSEEIVVDLGGLAANPEKSVEVSEDSGDERDSESPEQRLQRALARHVDFGFVPADPDEPSAVPRPERRRRRRSE